MLGLLGGIALAPALDQLFKAFGADLPDSGTVLETRTIVVSLLVGIDRDACSPGSRPALRATRVPPLAAMREGVEIPPRPLPTRRALIVRFGILLGARRGLRCGGVVRRGAARHRSRSSIALGDRCSLTCACAGERPRPRYRLVARRSRGRSACS